jgi:hypothetical protein
MLERSVAVDVRVRVRDVGPELFFNRGSPPRSLYPDTTVDPHILQCLPQGNILNCVLDRNNWDLLRKSLPAP